MRNTMLRCLRILWDKGEVFLFIFAVFAMPAGVVSSALRGGFGGIQSLMLMCGLFGFFAGAIQGRAFVRAVVGEIHIVNMFVSAFCLNCILTGIIFGVVTSGPRFGTITGLVTFMTMGIFFGVLVYPVWFLGKKAARRVMGIRAS